MIVQTDCFAVTTEIGALNTPFDDALDDLRISGSVLLHECYAPPWAIDIPDEDKLRAALGAERDVRIVPFHLVRAGAFDLLHEQVEPQRIDTDDVAICPSGAPHRMSFGKPTEAVSLTDVLAGRSPCARSDGSDATELVCGVFRLHAAPLNPLLGSLPRVLKVTTAGPGVDPLLDHAVAMLDLEVAKGPSSFVAARLLEVFFAEAIRCYGRGQGAARSGWFKAIDDPRIGIALSRLHQEPGAAWTVASLADTVAMSPSRFAARFREVTGRSAMSYVSDWRMTVACRLLRDTDDRLERIANTVGYQDLASFSRAFKASVGRSPSRWRAER